MRDQIATIGLVVNPYAGVGGAAAYKGSDAVEIQKAAQAGGLPLVAVRRVSTFLNELVQAKLGADTVKFISAPGVLGGDYFTHLSLSSSCIDLTVAEFTCAEDTKRAVVELQKHPIDLLVFLGGDGTARDVCSVISTDQLVLGVPSGVKMHSGVFAVSPTAAAELIAQWLAGKLVSTQMQEVRDIDENLFREGRVASRYFGEMQTLISENHIQHVKQGGFEVEDLVLADIAEDLLSVFDPSDFIIMGPGSTTYNIAKNWGLETSLLGVDVLQNGSVLALDVTAEKLLKLTQGHPDSVHLVITAIGGQGHIVGRGNQQLSPDFLRMLDRNRVHIVSTKTKLKSLNGRPLLMDSGDPALDLAWAGFVNVICGYQDRVYYRIGNDHA